MPNAAPRYASQGAIRFLAHYVRRSIFSHAIVLVAGDNLLWRLAGWVSTHAFVAVGGDIRLDLFNHLSGQGTRYFIDRFPGALAGRITAAANAAWTIEISLTS